MKVTVVTSATGVMVATSDVKVHVRMTASDDDAIIGDYVFAAQEQAEQVTSRKMMPQTWRLFIDDWPRTDTIELPFAPLRSVPSTGIVYKNSTGGSTTFSSTAWSVDVASEPGRVVLEYNDTWPSVTLHNNNPISIEFECGYAGTSAIPQRFKQAVHMLVGHFYENRESVIVQSFGQISVAEIPQGFFSLLSDKMHRF